MTESSSIVRKRGEYETSEVDVKICPECNKEYDDSRRVCRECNKVLAKIEEVRCDDSTVVHCGNNYFNSFMPEDEADELAMKISGYGEFPGEFCKEIYDKYYCALVTIFTNEQKVPFDYICDVFSDNEDRREIAKVLTSLCEKKVAVIESILRNSYGIAIDSILDEALITKTHHEPKPKLEELKVPEEVTVPDEANYDCSDGFCYNIFPFMRSNLKRVAEKKFVEKMLAYHTEVEEREQIIAKNEEINKRIESWMEKQKIFEKETIANNRTIMNYKNGSFPERSEDIEDYFHLIIEGSSYPIEFAKDFEGGYNKEAKMLIVEYLLPNIDAIPKTKEIKYVKVRKEFSEKYLPENTLNKLYDSLLYQIALRTINDCFRADRGKCLDSIVFNGIVNFVNKGTGRNEVACILSLQVSSEEMEGMNLRNVDPKSCFKQLKGVGSSKLHGLAPVAPIVQLNKKDKRFVDAYSVTQNVNAGTNLAAMDWQDFEHLIRELFEKEFLSVGGEVKITRASRDEGVDAIAFDPDPIRGGKIVIQAKRYTNIVGVSAVRDLYGTVMNEGANKGILVTTTDYGPDAYKFAKDKPITLLNGGNLLHLLTKHGHKAHIDVRAAKAFFLDKE